MFGTAFADEQPTRRGYLEGAAGVGIAVGGIEQHEIRGHRGDGVREVFTVGRARFDRWYAEQARSKGALVVHSTVATDLLRDSKGNVNGVLTSRAEGEVTAKVTILADGINSPLATQAGFRPDLKAENVALAVKEVIALPGEVIEQRFGVREGNGITT